MCRPLLHNKMLIKENKVKRGAQRVDHTLLDRIFEIPSRGLHHIINSDILSPVVHYLGIICHVTQIRIKDFQ